MVQRGSNPSSCPFEHWEFSHLIRTRTTRPSLTCCVTNTKSTYTSTHEGWDIYIYMKLVNKEIKLIHCIQNWSNCPLVFSFNLEFSFFLFFSKCMSVYVWIHKQRVGYKYIHHIKILNIKYLSVLYMLYEIAQGRTTISCLNGNWNWVLLIESDNMKILLGNLFNFLFFFINFDG